MWRRTDRKAVDSRDLEAPHPAIGDQSRQGTQRQRGSLGIRERRSVLIDLPPRSRYTTGSPSTSTTYAPAARGRHCGSHPPSIPATAGSCHMDWRDPWRRAAAHRATRRSPDRCHPARSDPPAAGPVNRAGRTGRRRAPPRSSRAGAGPDLPSRAGWDRWLRSRRARPRQRRHLASTARSGRAAAVPGHAAAPCLMAVCRRRWRPRSR